MKYNNLFKLLLILSSILIWYLIYLAKISEYTKNFFYEFEALIISLLVCFFTFYLLWFKKTFFKKNCIFIYLFYIFSSPISIIVFIRIYVEFFGPFFKL